MSKEYKSLVQHDPENGIWGDCYRVGIAWLLQIPPEDVPHFYENGPDNPEEACAQAKAFVREHGYELVVIAYEAKPATVMASISHYSPQARYLLTGLSGKYPDTNHVVCCKGTSIEVDPTDSGINGPCTDGYTWIEFLSI